MSRLDDDLNAEWAKLAVAVTELQAGAQEAVGDILHAAHRRISQLLLDQPSDYQQWRLGALQQSIRRLIDEGYQQASDTAADRQFSAWKQGSDAVTKPMATLGVQFNALSNETILAMAAFQTDKLKEVTDNVRGIVNARLSGVVLGMETPFEAMKGINEVLDGGKGLKRAQTIVVTEVGRAFSHATYTRLQQMKEQGIAVKVRWRRSGKIYSRVSHDIVDGQLRDVDDPFVIEGESVLYPRAPGVSAKNSVNCGCAILPVVEGFEEQNPGRRAFSEEEMRLNRTKRDLEAVRI